MKIPQKDLGQWATQIAEQCNVSVPRRVNDSILWRSYMLDGSAPGKQALFNKTGIHVDQLASELFSPSETRFWLERTRYAPQEIAPLLEEASNVLTDHFIDDGIGVAVAQALPWALAFGKAFIKLSVQGFDNDKGIFQLKKIKPYITMPYEIGVYREDYDSLEDQEAICQTFYITYEEFLRMIKGHPREQSIKMKVEGKMSASTTGEEAGYHRIFMGGTQPIITQGQPSPAGFASLRPNAPSAELAPEVADKIIKMHELWIWDDDRDDWTTLQFVAGGIMIEGELQHRNLFVDGLLPYAEICPNPIEGNFWGLSEIAPLRKLQDALNDRIGDILMAQELQLKKPRAYIGFEGATEEKYAAAKKPFGVLTESNFQAKVEDLAPEVPKSVEESVHELINMFDKVAGFTPVLQGEGTQGVRSQGHADTLVRQSSPRLRDRALLLEQQVAALGDLAFQVLQQKDAHLHRAANGKEFYLASLEDEFYSITIDAHSSSPVFSRDALQLALLLHHEGAIDNEDLLRLTHPPMFTTLIARLREREAARQKFMQEHPELALEGGSKKKKGHAPIL